MAEPYVLDLAGIPFGSNDIDRLLRRWRQEPRPLAISEIADLYLSLEIESRHGLVLYDPRRDPRRAYKVGDKIVVHAPKGLTTISNDLLPFDDHTALFIVVEVLDVTFTRIYVRDLSPLPRSGTPEVRIFIANYQGQDLDSAAVQSGELRQKMEKAGLLGRLLSALSGDKRFVNVEDRWLPSDLLDSRLRDQIDRARLHLAKNKQPMTVSELLSRLAGTDSDTTGRMEFSLQYFLEKDGRFQVLEGDPPSCDLEKPPEPIEVRISKRYIDEEEFPVTGALDQMFFYHGHVEKCRLVFPNGEEVAARYDAALKNLRCPGIRKRAGKTIAGSGSTLWFWHPHQRGEAIRASTCEDLPPGPGHPSEWSVTVREEWLPEGILRLPHQLASLLPACETVSVRSDEKPGEPMEYDSGAAELRGLGPFYQGKALAPGDHLRLRLVADDPPTLFLSALWRMSLDKLLRLEPNDLDWQSAVLRDCIIVVLAHKEGPAHYREIYAEVSTHRHTSLGAVGGTLSRYCPAVFTHAGWGEWQLAGQQPPPKPRKPEELDSQPPPPIPPEVWDAIERIEAQDYVYKLLKRLGRPLSFEAICSRAAAVLHVDPEALQATGFLNAADPRLRRLEDGTWALEEWFQPPEKTAEDKTPEARPLDQNLAWLAVMATAAIVILVILVWSFIREVWP